MLNVTLKLESIHCHRESDNWFSSEPYLWSVFFHADIDTILRPRGERLFTTTPHANWTTRGMYRDGVDAGEDVVIPASIGTYRVSLDDGGLGNALVGVLFVLLEQDSTDGGAIRAGHEALAAAADRVLNAYVDDHFPNVPLPTPEQVEAMAADIKAEVVGAIADAQGWQDVFDDQDDLLGFGYRIYTLDDLLSFARPGGGTDRFSGRITQTMTTPPGNQQVVRNDYEVFGSIEARSYTMPLPDLGLAPYREAVDALMRVDEEIENLRGKIRMARDDARGKLIEELQFKRRVTRPALTRAVTSRRLILTSARTDELAPAEGLRGPVRGNAIHHRGRYRDDQTNIVAMTALTGGASPEGTVPPEEEQPTPQPRVVGSTLS